MWSTVECHIIWLKLAQYKCIYYYYYYYYYFVHNDSKKAQVKTGTVDHYTMKMQNLKDYL